MIFGERIKQLRKEKGWLQKELAEKAGVSPDAVSLWETCARAIPRAKTLKKLAKAFGVTEGELLSPIPSSEAFPIQRVPVISWIHANKFQGISDVFPVGISDEHILTTTKGKNVFALRVFNDCMAPEFNEGDIIVVNPSTDVEHGNYVIVADRDEDTATFKQFKQYGNKKILHPLNPKYQDIELDHKKRYVIVGKVVEKIKRY
jgi:SOS-response transcriptional repressor LexA